MNVNATEGELRAVAETLKLAAILDDRAPRADKPRITAWAERIHEYRLARSDLLDGLQAFYDQPQDRPVGIGDLIHHARAAKRGRLDREADDDREQRRAELDRKAAEDMAALAAGAVMGPAPKTDRLLKAETALQCCTDRASAMQAIGEYFAAKREARKASA